MDRVLRKKCHQGVPRTPYGMDTETDPSIPVEAVEERQEPEASTQTTGNCGMETVEMETGKQLLLEDGRSHEPSH